MNSYSLLFLGGMTSATRILVTRAMICSFLGTETHCFLGLMWWTSAKDVSAEDNSVSSRGPLHEYLIKSRTSSGLYVINFLLSPVLEVICCQSRVQLKHFLVPPGQRIEQSLSSVSFNNIANCSARTSGKIEFFCLKGRGSNFRCSFSSVAR